jgi:exopolyphosphatase/pppGpp-phosphohydrolase
LLDPDFRHSMHVARLSLQLYDGLTALGKPSPFAAQERAILQVAALLHDVGRSKDDAGHQKASHRMIRRLPSPLGWPAQDLLTAGIVARYHCGALPRAGQKALRGLSLKQRQDIARLAGILRLANAFDTSGDRRVQRLQVVNGSNGSHANKVLVIAAQGYSARDDQAQAIAAARHLLELVYRRPVMVKPQKLASRKPKLKKPETRR